jgi:hypothetical protein
MKTLLLLWLLPALAVAQGLVNVNNRGLNPARLVVGPDGDPLVGNNFVAQIVYGATPETVTNELGAPMPFRVATTTSPGTWNPGREGVRTVPGFPSGTTMWMRVRVWDSLGFGSWSEMASATNPVACLGGSESEIFPVVLGFPDQPTTGGIGSFPGMRLPLRSDQWPCSVGSRHFAAEENGPAVFIPDDFNRLYSAGRSDSPIFLNPRVASVTATNGGWWFRGTPNACGSLPMIYRYGFFQGAPWIHPPSAAEYLGYLFLRVTPSPRRPFLDFTLTNSRPALTMRGLPPRRYGIEGSTNLAGWTRLGELSLGEDGNAPVPDAWLATDTTQFVRFVTLP